jgi:hypothetical protein
MAREKKAFALRLDAALHDAIQRLAGAELRSVNGQIEYLLREALRARGLRVNETGEAAGDADEAS